MSRLLAVYPSTAVNGKLCSPLRKKKDADAELERFTQDEVMVARSATIREACRAKRALRCGQSVRREPVSNRKMDMSPSSQHGGRASRATSSEASALRAQS